MALLNDMDLSHLTGQRVGSTTLLKEIARGSMGAVFIGFQSNLKRQIAVKVLPKSILTPQNARLFQQEAELAAFLSHPNIIPVYEIGDAGEFLFISMQYVKGKSLSYYINRAHKNPLPSKKILPLKTTFSIIISILKALEYAHHNSIIHRDIKPGNILIENYEKRPIIVDFGLAKVVQKPDETSSMIVGTPLYIAPEQILKKDVDGRADIYSTAMMLRKMLIPIPLFPGLKSAEEILRFKIKQKDKLFTQKVSEITPELNEEIDRILIKALSFKPESRYAACREFREHLELYARSFIKK